MSMAQARELAVLGVLAAHPAHGYEIAKALSSGPFALLGLSRPAVYAILDRFRARDWLTETKEAGGPYPDRTVLHLTPAAHAELDTRITTLGADPMLATLPLVAILMSFDGGAALPPHALEKMIDARRAMLAALPGDAAHQASATQRLAQRVVQAEIDVLTDLLDTPA